MSETQTWRDQDERRYELTRDVAEEVLAKLGEQLPVMTYNDAPPTTLVATVYFDTPDRYYLERAKAANGTSSIKVRAREYMPVTDDDAREVLGFSEFCYLERKERTGTVRQKYRIRIAKSDLSNILEHMMDLPEECDLLRTEVRDHELEPVLISMYERRVWGRSDDLRITFDERIRYYRPQGHPFDQVGGMAPDQMGAPRAVGPKRILEVKHSAAVQLPAWLSELLATLPEASGFSKFLDGMAKIDGGSSRARTSLTRPVFKLP